ncbi:hypothetical protein D3C78_920520 [compost metagenome]
MQNVTICRSNRQTRDSIGQMPASACVCAATFRELTLAMGCHALATHMIDLQRTDQALRVVGVDACGRLRVHFGELAVQLGQTQRLRPGLEFGTHRSVSRRHVRQAIDQCLVVEHGATDQQRDFAARGDFGHGLKGIGAKLRSRVALGRVANIDKTMWMGSQYLLGGLGAADVHAAVDEGRVDADQLAGQDLGQLDGKVGLAGRRRAHEEYCWGLAAHVIDRAGKVCPGRPGPSGSRSVGHGCTGRYARCFPCRATGRSFQESPGAGWHVRRRDRPWYRAVR